MSYNQQRIEEYLPMVISIAKQFQGNYLPLEELVKEGTLALIRADAAYSETCGRSFSLYAGDAVRKAMIAAIAKHK